MHIIFLSGTKCLWLPQYVNKFLVWHKKFGPAKNILGPVKGQGMWLKKLLVLTKKKSNESSQIKNIISERTRFLYRLDNHENNKNLVENPQHRPSGEEKVFVFDVPKISSKTSVFSTSSDWDWYYPWLTWEPLVRRILWYFWNSEIWLKKCVQSCFDLSAICLSVKWTCTARA